MNERRTSDVEESQHFVFRDALRAAAGVLAAGLFAAGAVLAQGYPSKPVRITVGVSPGGGTDVIARMLGEKCGESLKQPFIVDNCPIASNTIAADLSGPYTADNIATRMAFTRRVAA